MKLPICAMSALFITTAMSALGCSVDTSNEASMESVGQTKDDLSVYRWSADSHAADNHSYDPASIATFSNNGSDLTIMVHTGALGYDNDHLFWAKSYDGINWMDDREIDDMYSSSPARLEAFNGYLYMVHTGAHDSSVWMSRFNASTMSWDHDFQLPYYSSTSPALASYNGSLYIIGSTSSTRQLWQATMSTSEVFSPASNIPGQFADVPSLAVHCASTFCFPATLYMAYKSSAGEVTMSGLQATFSRRGVNTTWWTPWVVTNMDGSHKRTWVQPAIASYGGYLHLIDTPTTSDLIAWSYYDGASWSLDVNIGGQRMWSNASLSARSDRLVMIHPPSSVDHTSNGTYTVYAEYFQ